MLWDRLVQPVNLILETARNKTAEDKPRVDFDALALEMMALLRQQNAVVLV